MSSDGKEMEDSPGAMRLWNDVAEYLREAGIGRFTVDVIDGGAKFIVDVADAESRSSRGGIGDELGVAMQRGVRNLREMRSKWKR